MKPKPLHDINASAQTTLCLLCPSESFSGVCRDFIARMTDEMLVLHRCAACAPEAITAGESVDSFLQSQYLAFCMLPGSAC